MPVLLKNEIDLPGLRELSSEPRQIMPDIQKFKLSDGKIIYLFGKGNSINLTAGDGNPIEVMDLGSGPAIPVPGIPRG